MAYHCIEIYFKKILYIFPTLNLPVPNYNLGSRNNFRKQSSRFWATVKTHPSILDSIDWLIHSDPIHPSITFY